MSHYYTNIDEIAVELDSSYVNEDPINTYVNEEPENSYLDDTNYLNDETDPVDQHDVKETYNISNEAPPVELLDEVKYPSRAWIDEYKELLKKSNGKDINSVKARIELSALMTSFLETAEHLARIIISEADTPNEKKQIQALDGVHGIAGGEKFIKHNLFFKRLHNALGIYSSEGQAMKTANLEVTGAKLFADSPFFFTPLLCIVNYCGSRLLVSSVLDISEDTLAYGSADAGKTIHQDPDIAQLMNAFGTVTGLAQHRVRTRDGIEMQYTGPVDIEVHKTGQAEYWVLDTARMLPFEGPHDTTDAVVLPPTNKETWVHHRVLLQTPLNQDKSSSGGKKQQVLTLSELRRMTLASPTHGGETPVRVNLRLPADADLYIFTSPKAGIENINATKLLRISSYSDITAYGSALYVRSGRKRHLTDLLRPEFVKAYCATHESINGLSSDAFTAFGRLDAKQHNAAVKAATKYLHEHVLQLFTQDCVDGRIIPSNGAALTKIMHERGINIRCLGRLYAMLHYHHRLKIVILVEMITRAIKGIIRGMVRGQRKLFVPLVRRVLNVVLGQSDAADFFWNVTLRLTLVNKFGYHAYNNNRVGSEQPYVNVRSQVNHTQLFRSLQLALGVILSDGCIERYAAESLVFAAEPLRIHGDVLGGTSFGEHAGFHHMLLYDELISKLGFENSNVLLAAVEKAMGPQSIGYSRVRVDIARNLLTRETAPSVTTRNEALHHLRKAYQMLKVCTMPSMSLVAVCNLIGEIAFGLDMIDDAIESWHEAMSVLSDVYGPLYHLTAEKNFENEKKQQNVNMQSHPSILVLFNHLASAAQKQGRGLDFKLHSECRHANDVFKVYHYSIDLARDFNIEFFGAAIPCMYDFILPGYLRNNNTFTSREEGLTYLMKLPDMDSPQEVQAMHTQMAEIRLIRTFDFKDVQEITKLTKVAEFNTPAVDKTTDTKALDELPQTNVQVPRYMRLKYPSEEDGILIASKYWQGFPIGSFATYLIKTTTRYSGMNITAYTQRTEVLIEQTAKKSVIMHGNRTIVKGPVQVPIDVRTMDLNNIPALSGQLEDTLAKTMLREDVQVEDTSIQHICGIPCTPSKTKFTYIAYESGAASFAERVVTTNSVTTSRLMQAVPDLNPGKDIVCHFMSETKTTVDLPLSNMVVNSSETYRITHLFRLFPLPKQPVSFDSNDWQDVIDFAESFNLDQVPTNDTKCVKCYEVNIERTSSITTTKPTTLTEYRSTDVPNGVCYEEEVTCPSQDMKITKVTLLVGYGVATPLQLDEWKAKVS